jgi:hypothetical protein
MSRQRLALRGRLFSIVGVLGGVVFLVAAAPAGAATWLETAVPGGREEGAPSGRSEDAVSCASATSCVAVDNRSAYRWNGVEWTLEALPNTKVPWVDLHAVSCASETACTAVGSETGSPGLLAERWNGTEWSNENLPAPTGREPDLEANVYAVSCSSATACMAVGAVINAEGGWEAFSESWNGTAWSVDPMVSPAAGIPEAGNAEALSVSCTSATECTAVGLFSDHAWTMFAERWDGTKWSLQSIPAPVTEGKPTEQSRLYGVSCYSATECTAVGTYSVELGIKGPNGEKRGYYSGLAEQWNGTTWSQQALPGQTPLEVEEILEGKKPTEVVEAKVLAAVSCVASATSCTAVGVGAKTGASHTTLAEHWNGTEWSVESTPTPGSPPPELPTILEGVSCPSITVCVAFGRDSATSNGLLAEVDPPEEMVQKIAEAETRRHEEEAAEKKVHEEEAATKKANEEKLAAEMKANKEKVAALKTAEEKEAAEKKAHEEEAAAEKKVHEEEAAAKNANEEKLAEKKESEEKVAVRVGQVATLATVPVVLPTKSTTVGSLPSGVKRLTEAQKLNACKRLPRKRRIACEAKVKKSYSGKYRKK